MISIHSLVRGRTFLVVILRSAFPHFNPLPRERENEFTGNSERVVPYFNPLPRERENLTAFYAFLQSLQISIHSLVRGITHRCRRLPQPLRYFNPLPRERENCFRSLLHGQCSYFNPLPRERENSDKVQEYAARAYISIHSLVRGRTLCPYPLWRGKAFQSTPS